MEKKRKKQQKDVVKPVSDQLSKNDKKKLGEGPVDISGTGSNYLESDFVSV